MPNASLGALPRDSLVGVVADEDIKKPINQTNLDMTKFIRSFFF